MRGNKENITEAVLIVDIVRGRPLVEYLGDEDFNYLKITVALHKFVPAVKRLLETTTIYPPMQHHTFIPYESNVDIETR